jgi:NTE family protein
VIEPTKPLGDTLDFSPETIRLRMHHGEEMAREVIQRTGVSAPRLAATLPTPEHPFPA